MEWSSLVGCILLTICCISHSLLAFNLEPKLAIVKKGPPGSYFGYSIAPHLLETPGSPNNIDDYLMLVGAPRDNVTGVSATSPGALYKCTVTTSSRDDCEIVGRRNIYATRRNEDINDQWLGVTVKSNQNKVIVCAHRNKLSDQKVYKYGIGACKVLSNALDYRKRLEFCSAKSSGGHETLGYCQAGTSASFLTVDHVLIGAPGANNWIGGAFKTTQSDDPRVKTETFSTPMFESKTPGIPNPPVGSYSYAGMSTSTGNILGNVTYVVGAPRASRVILFTQSPAGLILTYDEKHILRLPVKEGEFGENVEKFGASFGHEVVVMDINRDGRDDLVVSAPFFIEKNIGGMVYVYMNGPGGITVDTTPIEIKSRTMTTSECKAINCEMARFGFSLANIGDINLDGYPDLAIGAPYEGDGAVYIYHGDKDGVKTMYSQRIASADISSKPKSFGSSLGGGIDLDNNGYADLMVGAFESDSAILLPSRPVMEITAKVVDMDKLIVDPKARSCVLDTDDRQCFKIRVCFKFTAQPVDRFTQRYKVKYTVEEMKKTLLPRLVFKDAANPADFNTNYKFSDEIEMNRQSRDKDQCNNHIVYISTNNKDIQHAVPMLLTYELDSAEPTPLVPGESLLDINNFPILNVATSKIDFEVNFKKDCGPDKVCTADLSVSGSWEGLPTENGVAVLSLGTVPELFLNIKYKNIKEKAYNAMLYVFVPIELKFRKGGHSENGVTCETVNKNDTILACQVGNPFENNTETMIRIPFQPPQTTKNMLDVVLLVNTSSEESDFDKKDNSVTVKLRVIVKAEMLITGASDPEQLIYKGEVKGENAIEFEEDIGDQVTHTYVVRNGGPGIVVRSEVEIQWPYEVENKRDKGKHLLYMTQEPTLEGPGRCEIDPKWVNSLGVQVKRIPNRFEVPVITTPRPSNDSEEVVTYTPSRKKREVVVRAEEIRDKDGKIQKVVKMNCVKKTAKCFTFKCYLGNLKSQADVVIKIRSRLWRSTFVEDYKDVHRVEIQSQATIILDPDLHVEQTKTSNDVAFAETVAQPDTSLQPPPEGVAIWIIIVSACAGVLLLVILIVVLWKLGFFRRRRPEDEMQQHEVKVVKDKYKYDEVAASEC